MRNSTSLHVTVAAALLALVMSAPAPAQNGASHATSVWSGIWVAQGTVFSVAVQAENGVFRVKEQQSLGFVWSAKPGQVDGDRATLEVQYAGVTARLRARLLNENTAVVEATQCVPEFMVVCTLARGQQAVFVRQ